MSDRFVEATSDALQESLLWHILTAVESEHKYSPPTERVRLMQRSVRNYRQAALPRLVAIILLILSTLAVHPVTGSGPARRPNVVLILTDDQGYGDLGVHGNPKIKTPHLDALAAASAELRSFYVSPVCTPTRASLMTGRYNY